MRRGLVRISLLSLCIATCACASVETRETPPPPGEPIISYRSPGDTTYYVDGAQGNDRNDGTTPDNAWKSLDRVNSTLFVAGDKILFKAGSRFAGQLRPQGSGREGAAIVIDVYGEGDRPLIEAKGRYHEALLLRNQEYWEVNGLELTNTGSTRERFRYGVRVVAWDFGTMRHIHLKNLFIRDVNGSLKKEDRGEGHGIAWENGGSKIRSRFDGLLIEKCHLLRTDRNGICGYSQHSDRRDWFPSLNVVIRDNLLEDIGGDGIKVWGCEDALVEHNRLYGGRQRCDDYAAGIWPWSSDRTIIQFNEVSGMKGTRDGQAFDSDGNCKDTLLQYNYSHDNDGGFMLICSSGEWKMPSMTPNTGTVIRYNISQNDRARTFHFGGPTKNTKIYNNVFFVGKGLEVDVFLYTDWEGWSDEVYVHNNILYAEGKVRYSYGASRNDDGTYNPKSGFGQSTNNRFENNVYFGNHESAPPDPKAIRLDPLLVASGSGGSGLDTLEGYKLKDGSPCIGTGIQVQDNGGRDFWENPVPTGENPDIGAYQKQR